MDDTYLDQFPTECVLVYVYTMGEGNRACLGEKVVREKEYRSAMAG